MSLPNAAPPGKWLCQEDSSDCKPATSKNPAPTGGARRAQSAATTRPAPVRHERPGTSPSGRRPPARPATAHHMPSPPGALGDASRQSSPRGQRLVANNAHSARKLTITMTAGQMEAELQKVADLNRSMYEAKVRQRFLVAKLNAAAGGGGVASPELKRNDLVDSRLTFLQTCMGRHWQFNELRRAQYSTMMILAMLSVEML